MTTVERIAYWTKQVERWEMEGGSRKVFCEEYGIGYASFLSWCKRLRRDGISLDNSDTLTCLEVRYFAYLEQAGYLYISPTAMMRLPKNIRHHHRAYGEDEIRAILDLRHWPRKWTPKR